MRNPVAPSSLHDLLLAYQLGILGLTGSAWDNTIPDCWFSRATVPFSLHGPTVVMRFRLPLQENKFEYTSIHNEFKQLVDQMLTEFLAELGVSPEDLLQVRSVLSVRWFQVVLTVGAASPRVIRWSSRRAAP